MMAHEFIYLLANASDRLEQITSNHERVLNERENLHYDVQHWEIAETGGSEQPQIQHIHLLEKDAFVNHAPHHLVTEGLQRQNQERPFVFVGGYQKPQIGFGETF